MERDKGRGGGVKKGLRSQALGMWGRGADIFIIILGDKQIQIRQAADVAYY